MSAVAIAFNVTDTQTHLRITDMNLTPRLVAMLIAGQQPVVGPGSHLFQDPEFLALNPGHSWPANTPPPLLRAEQNADAYLLTRWLQEDPAARTYLDGNDARPVDANWKGIAYPTDIFEARNPVNQGTYKPRSGTVQNIRRLFNFQPPGDGVLISPFFEGLTAVTDVVTAQKFGLPVAKLRAANAPAGPFVAPDTPGLAAGVAAMKPNGDQTKQADVQSAGGAYPLTKVDYAIVPQSGITEAKAGNIAAFLKFVAAKGQDAKTLPQGYSALPQDLRNQTVLVADATVKAAQPVTTPPTTVAPTNPSSGDGATPDVPDTNGDGQITTADVPSFNFNSPSFNSGSYSSSGFDDSTGGTGDEVALGDDSGSADGGGVDGGGSSGDAEAIAVHFGGGESNLVLPVLLILGVGMLVFGPVALLLARRNAGGPKPSKPPTIPQLPQPPETIALDA